MTCEECQSNNTVFESKEVVTGKVVFIKEVCQDCGWFKETIAVHPEYNYVPPKPFERIGIAGVDFQ